MKKVLIIGASSCLGSNLASYLRRDYLVYGTYARHAPRIDGVPCFQMVLNEATPLIGVLTALKPDSVIYCSGITDTRLCEQNSELAFSINATFAGAVASVLSRFGSRLIYLSSSKVFSGNKGSYTESDFPDPQDAYGSSKRQAEEILRRYENIFILRLPTMYALGSLNQQSMLNRMLRRFWSKEPIPCIDDERRTFVSAADLCLAIGILLDADPVHEGIYHLGASHSDTYYGFATKLARVFGYPTKLIEPVSGKKFHQHSYHHHTDLSLAAGEFRRQFGFEPEKPEKGLARIQSGLKHGRFLPVPG